MMDWRGVGSLGISVFRGVALSCVVLKSCWCVTLKLFSYLAASFALNELKHLPLKILSYHCQTSPEWKRWGFYLIDYFWHRVWVSPLPEIFGNLYHPRNLGHYYYFAKSLMRNLGNPRSIASCYCTKYGPSCKSCWYRIKVFSENMGHPEPIKI